MKAAIRAPLPDPPLAADEKTTLGAFLDWYRDALLRKLEGLDKEAATRSLVRSATTLLGMVKHLAYVERGWSRSREIVTGPASTITPVALTGRLTHFDGFLCT